MRRKTRPSWVLVVFEQLDTDHFRRRLTAQITHENDEEEILAAFFYCYGQSLQGLGLLLLEVIIKVAYICSYIWCFARMELFSVTFSALSFVYVQKEGI